MPVEHACRLIINISVSSLECPTHGIRDRNLQVLTLVHLGVLLLLGLVSEVPYSVIEVALYGLELRIKALVAGRRLRTARVDQL